MSRTRKIVRLVLGASCVLTQPAFQATAADLPALSHTLTVQRAQPAPVLKLKGLDGRQHELSRLKGKVVLVNFWATWCPPCRREMPSMQRLMQAFAGQSFVVLAVNVGETADAIDLFTSQLDARPEFPILLDETSQAMRAWNVAGLPTTFLIDRQGRVVASAIGGREFDHPELVRAIRELIRK